MGKKQPKTDGLDYTTGLPVTNGLQTELDPITNLPTNYHNAALNKQYHLPDGDWDMNTIINDQTVQDFHNNRFNRPTVFPGNIYDNDDVDWDVKDYADVNRQLAENQSGWDQFGNWFVQSVVGEIVGGTMEGFGALIDAFDGDLQDDYDNWLGRTGQGIREWSKDEFPIYQKPTSNEWNPSDSGWWAQNGVSVVSSISMMIPGWAAVKGVGYASRLARAANVATKGIKGAKASSAIANTLNLSRTA